MRRSKIERHFKSGEYQQALVGLETIEVSAWADTTKLRCMRALRHKGTAHYADQLKTKISRRSDAYSMNTSERNNLLRYIALVYAEQNRPKDACKIIAKLCKESPNVAALHREYAFALANCSRFDMAESELNRAIELQANNVNSHAQLAHIYCITGRVDAGWHSYSRAAILEPDNATYIQRLLFWSNYTERATEQSNYQLTQLWAKKAFPETQSVETSQRIAAPDRRLKLGLVSSDFNSQVISSSLLPLLENLNKADFDVILYSDTKNADHVTESISGLCDCWCDTSKISDTELAELVSAQEVDVLVDLNGHNRGNRLGVFVMRVAPIQLSWLGYPASTGLKSIPYRISDRIADPLGPHDQFYSEKLLYLPNGYLCYKPPAISPDVQAIESQVHIRFGSFNSLDKVSNLTLDCWASALLAVAKSTLTIKHQQLSSKNARAYVLKQLAERGITHDRVILNESKEKGDAHLNGYNEIDIALDTSPYNGTTAALEALWMGVPVISLSGRTHASRLTASILHRLDLDHLATKSIFEYAERARELSENTQTLQELRVDLRERIRESPLMNHTQFAREFSNVIRRQWRHWCNTQDPDRSALEFRAGAK